MVMKCAWLSHMLGLLVAAASLPAGSQPPTHVPRDAAQIVESMGASVATPDEAREMLNLKPRS